MKKKTGIAMERALARPNTKEGYVERMLGTLFKRIAEPGRQQRPHWFNLPPLTT